MWQIPMAAWRRLDGSYAIRTPFPIGDFQTVLDDWRIQEGREELLKAGGHKDTISGDWVVPESALGRLGAYRLFVVILAGFCCSSPSGSVARESDIRRGKVFRVSCRSCGARAGPSALWEVPIVEVCGEGEEGQQTYDAAFRDAIEGGQAGGDPGASSR